MLDSYISVGKLIYTYIYMSIKIYNYKYIIYIYIYTHQPTNYVTHLYMLTGYTYVDAMYINIFIQGLHWRLGKSNG